MKYATRQYAEALYGALRDAESKDRQAILKRFYAYIVRNRDQQHVERILEEVGDIHSRREGLHTVTVESVSPMSSGIKKEIEKIFGGKVILRESINPKLFAGIKFIIDGDTVIDASAQGQLRKLFS